MRHFFATALVALAVAQPALAAQIELETEVFTLSATLDDGLNACVRVQESVLDDAACAQFLHAMNARQGDLVVFLRDRTRFPTVISFVALGGPLYAETTLRLLEEQGESAHAAALRNQPGGTISAATSEITTIGAVPAHDRRFVVTSSIDTMRMRGLTLAGATGWLQVTVASAVDDADRADAIVDQLLSGLVMDPAPFRGADPMAPTALLLETCDAGNIAACGIAAWQLQLDEDANGNRERVLELGRPACAAGDFSGCDAVAATLFKDVFLTDSQNRGVLIESVPAAIEANERLCNVDPAARPDTALEAPQIATACLRAALLYRNHRAEAAQLRDRRHAADLLERACDDGGGRFACLNFGIALLDGDGGEVDAPRAIEHLVPQCEDGESRACVVGTAFTGMPGVPVDRDRARALLTLGCDQDDARSCAALNDLDHPPLPVDLGSEPLPLVPWYQRVPLSIALGIAIGLAGLLLVVRGERQPRVPNADGAPARDTSPPCSPPSPSARTGPTNERSS